MSQHYNKIQSGKAPHIETGNYYVVFEDGSWHRVRCIDFNIKNGMVTVSFIDYGDEDIFHFSRLQVLDKKFCALPAQVCCFNNTNFIVLLKIFIKNFIKLYVRR